MSLKMNSTLWRIWQKNILTIFFTVSFTGTGAWIQKMWEKGFKWHRHTNESFWEKWVKCDETFGVLYSQSPSQPFATILTIRSLREELSLLQPLGRCLWNSVDLLSLNFLPLFPSESLLNFLPRPLPTVLRLPLFCVNRAMPTGDITWPTKRQRQRQIPRQRQRQRQRVAKCQAEPLFCVNWNNCAMRPPPVKKISLKINLQIYRRVLIISLLLI